MYKNFFVNSILLGYFLCWVSGQEFIVLNQDESPSSVASEQNQSEDGETSPTMILWNVSSINDFIRLLHRDGHPVSTDEVISNYSDQSGAQHINAGGRMAQPDDCSPRDTTVRLTFDTADPNVVYFPRCTKIERCGGCCASPYLECVPSYTERVSYKVIKARVPFPGSSHLEWNGEYAPIILDRHVQCRVQCSLTADKCGPKKEFLDRQCECRCRVYERCQPPKVWDPEVCECKCSEVLSCCKEGERCGLMFSPDTCECVIDTSVQFIRNQANITQEEMDAYLALLDNSNNALQENSDLALQDNSGVSVTSTSTTTTISTTTESTTPETSPPATANPVTTPQDHCASIHCPNGFTKTYYEDGTCSCNRNLRRPRSGR